jgi:hypothetical protein
MKFSVPFVTKFACYVLHYGTKRMNFLVNGDKYNINENKCSTG